MAITPDMISAVKVQFKKSIFEDDFVERGMTAWLTGVEYEDDSYKLYFDFTEFEAENDKYFRRVYNANSDTRMAHLDRRDGMFTAKEAGQYEPKYSVYFSVSNDKRNDTLFAEEIAEFLREVE